MQRLFAAELTFLIVFLFINGGKSLNCFVCRSDENSGCVENIQHSLAVVCPLKFNSTQVYCRTIIQKLVFTTEHEYVYIRECAYQRGPYGCYYFKWLEVAFQETCECDKDYCNHGLNNVPTDWILTVTFSFWVLIYLTKR